MAPVPTIAIFMSYEKSGTDHGFGGSISGKKRGLSLF
jgi:hypothetical protein